jgi:hypothetical protein
MDTSSIRTCDSQSNLDIPWAITPEEQLKYEAIFLSLNPINGKLSGEQCKPVLLNSQLPNHCLAKVCIYTYN